MQTSEERKERIRKWREANREKIREYQRRKRAENPERTRAYVRKWYSENKELRSEEWASQRRARYARNRDKHREYHRRKSEKARAIALAHYGPGGKAACNRCGIEDAEVLVLDHLDDSGAEHRRNQKSARKLALWVVKEGLPPGFQTLCHNCNFKKRLEHLRSRRSKNK